MADRSTYRIFNATLGRRTILSPHMARLTLVGAEIAEMATFAPDQRIKLFFPKDDGTPPSIENRPDWYDIYRREPLATRTPMRTYTIRTLRADRCEVDVDFVLHADGGPASRWAEHASIGSPIQISAPDANGPREPVGFEWNPPPNVSQVLLIGDETALPAIAGILEQLQSWQQQPYVAAAIEVPTATDRLDLPTWPGLDLSWLVRDRGEQDAMPYGAMMIDAADAASIPATALAAGLAASPETEAEDELVWDGADQTPNGFYAWIAGETAAVRRIRTHLTGKAVDPRLMNLMGYWRYGAEKPLGQSTAQS